MAPRVPDEAAIGLTAVESPNGHVNGAPALHVEPSDAAIDGIDALLVRTSGVRRVCWLTPFQVCYSPSLLPTWARLLTPSLRLFHRAVSLY